LCNACGTLFSITSFSNEKIRVDNDDTAFYGKQYWLTHQKQDLGFPDIHARARNDLTERNLHWLKALLQYCLPPARVLEIGCTHGSFIALLQQAGYEASGVEMSPWVVEYGRKTFDVPISVGPVETLDIPSASLDVIALMDVLEHLPDPVATMAHCLKLLKRDGLLLLQTPQFKEGMDYTVLVETNGAFLEQLKADEHLFLFSDQSATRLFQQLEAEHIQFEPAIFGHYDMFFAVSRAPFQTNPPEQVESTLLTTPNGRLALALLDLRQREEDLTQKIHASEADRTARGKQVETLTGMLKESEADRAERWVQIETLTRMLKESEAARETRCTQVETLTRMLKESQAEQETIFAYLRTMFARPSFRWLNRLVSFPEAKKLEERIEKPNE
jgi:2-polyprenyl-3-methyl-5-hydroxy-6-metoxy-1,4-benzoquinol methylase